MEALPLQILTPAEIATASPGDTISEPLVAIGGYPPYTWAAAPAGDLSIVATASVLTGTAPEEPGLYPVTLAVSDQTGEAIAGATSVSVELGELKITTPEELPRARTEEPLELTLEATGGVPPLTWSSAFTFPEEIALTPGGDLTGTPEDAYDFSFEATVTSASGETASRTFTLRTAPAVAPARDLQAFPSDQKAAFTWTLPDDPSLAEVVLVANAASPPTAPEDGNILYRGTANNHLATDLPENAQLHIAIFALDEEGDFSDPPSDAFAQLTLLPFTLAKADGSTNADPHADGIADYSPLSSNANGSHDLSRVLGPPDGPPSFGGGGAIQVVSLGATQGNGGSITLSFENNIITNGPGADFTVFENAFGGFDTNNSVLHRALHRRREPGWNHLPHDPLRLRPPFPFRWSDAKRTQPVFLPQRFRRYHPYPKQGHDPRSHRPERLRWRPIRSRIGRTRMGIRYVRITSTGDNWLTDINGDPRRATPRHSEELTTLTGEFKFRLRSRCCDRHPLLVGKNQNRGNKHTDRSVCLNMKYPTLIDSYRSNRSYEGFSQSWQIPTVTGNLGLWRAHHHAPTTKERINNAIEKIKQAYLLAFSPETLVRNQLVAANANRLRVRG